MRNEDKIIPIYPQKYTQVHLFFYDLFQKGKCIGLSFLVVSVITIYSKTQNSLFFLKFEN